MTASEPVTLARNAFIIGTQAPGQVEAPTMRVAWVVDERLGAIEPRLRSILTSLPAVFGQYFGSTPANHYAVVVFQGEGMDGGAFRQSFPLQLAGPVRPVDELVWSHGLAHEMLHLWIGNHIRGAEPAATSWFTKGFTDYLAIKLGYRAGLFDEAMLEQRLANIVRWVRLAPRLSPAVGLVEAGTRKHQHWERVYGGGAMVALLLDAEQPAALQAALRNLNDHAATPLTQAALLERLDASSGGAATKIFAAVDAGLEFGALVERFGDVGLEVTGFSSDGRRTPAALPRVGAVSFDVSAGDRGGSSRNADGAQTPIR